MGKKQNERTRKNAREKEIERKKGRNVPRMLDIITPSVDIFYQGEQGSICRFEVMAT